HTIFSRDGVQTCALPIFAADKAREELREMLGQNVLERVHVRVGRTVTEMETLAPEGAGYPKYASGVAYSEIGLVLLTEQPRYPRSEERRVGKEYSSRLLV